MSDRIETTCPECGTDWSATTNEPEYPLCSNTCLRHMRESHGLIEMQAVRTEIGDWGNQHGYCLLESEIDDLCVRLGPLVRLLGEPKQ